MELFRQQAVTAAGDPLLGDALLTPRISHSLACGLLLAWLVLCGITLASTSYARKETVTGWLEPLGGVIRVYAQREGKVAKLLVQEGDRVTKNQPLLIINGDRILSDGQHLEDLLLNEFNAQKDVLSRRLERAENLAIQRSNDLSHQKAAANRALVRINEQERTLNKQQALLNSQIQRQHTLVESGHIARSTLDPLEERSLSLRLQELSLAKIREEQHFSLGAIALKERVLKEETQDSLDAISYSLSETSQEIAELRGSRAYIIKASKAGRVSNLQIREGYRAMVNVPLMTITSESEALQANLMIPISASGFLRSGQTLSFRFDAFPYQKFGTYQGTIDSISNAVLLPSEVTHPKVPIATPTYKAKASLASPNVLAYGKPVPLRSGMTLAADITLENRSVLEWLLEPMISLRGRF